MADKEHMNLVIIGHVDHGKSTLTGRILLETGAIDPHIVEKYKKEAEEKGKGSFYFAWVMDGLKEERERGVTIDIGHKKFYTDKYYFTVIDAPGHRDFVKNMITGTSQADAAIITCSAIEGPQAQTKEHVFLATTLGVKQIIVAINKMDAVKYDEAKYNEAKDGMIKLMKMVGVKTDEVPFIPTSAYMGDNIKVASANTPLVQGTHPHRRSRRSEGPREAHREAPQDAYPGCLHHHRNRNRPRRTCRDWNPQAQHEGHVRAFPRSGRGQVHRDAPRAAAPGSSR